MTTYVLIPAHNEADNIAGLVCLASKYGRVVVVDDSSTDGTAVEAAKAGAIVLVNGIAWGREAQYGDGFKRGVRYALECDADEIVLMDAGGSHDPRQIPTLLYVLRHHRCDVVVGSRVEYDSHYRQRPHRWLLTQVATRILARLTEGKIHDYSSFRAFTRDAARQALYLSHDLDVRCHVFNLLLAHRMAMANMNIVEAGISYYGTTSTLNVRIALAAGAALVREVRMSASSRRRGICRYRG